MSPGSKSLPIKNSAFAMLALSALVGCNYQRTARVVDPGFQNDPPTVYVAKVKNILVGLPPSGDEVQAVVADPNALKSLIDQWMTTPEYQAKMLVFFELAFQQTQLTAADFSNMIPPVGLGVGGQIPLLLQNIRESFARTVLALVSQGRPLTDAFTTHQMMMTPALAELYAFLDARRLDDNAKVTDLFAAAHPGAQITVEASQGAIPIAQTIDPTSPNFLHWYNPQVGRLTGYPDPTCNVDPVVMPVDADTLHLLLYGAIGSHRTPAKIFCPVHTTTAYQMTAADFSTWRMVTSRPPKPGEAVTAFYDLPTLRTTNELVLSTPRVGFFTTPAFEANWPTNNSNQMRVTTNQALIVATSMQVDGTDTTEPLSTPGLDSAHALPGSACYGCHRLLDPTRSILSSTYSYYYFPQSDPTLTEQKGLFAFQGVIAPVATIDDFAQTLAIHPAVPLGWAQKLCYWVNSAPCATDDPEFQRIVAAFQGANLSWNVLVRELLSSPITTHTVPTESAVNDVEVVAVTRRDHLCAALSNRLGLTDVCGLDVVNAKTQGTLIAQVVSGLPSDGYGRGATVPVLPNQPTLFFRAGVENICAAVSQLVIDAPTTAANQGAKQWSSAQPDVAIADLVSLVMALTPSDARYPQAVSILKDHFTQATQSGATASDALKSTFVTACLSPSTIGIGM
jgi:hypothetical protein